MFCYPALLGPSRGNINVGMNTHSMKFDKIIQRSVQLSPFGVDF